MCSQSVPQSTHCRAIVKHVVENDNGPIIGKLLQVPYVSRRGIFQRSVVGGGIITLQNGRCYKKLLLVAPWDRLSTCFVEVEASPMKEVSVGPRLLELPSQARQAEDAPLSIP